MQIFINSTKEIFKMMGKNWFPSFFFHFEIQTRHSNMSTDIIFKNNLYVKAPASLLNAIINNDGKPEFKQVINAYCEECKKPLGYSPVYTTGCINFMDKNLSILYCFCADTCSNTWLYSFNHDPAKKGYYKNERDSYVNFI